MGSMTRRLSGTNVLTYQMDSDPKDIDRWARADSRTGWRDIPTQPAGFDNTMGWTGLARHGKIRTGIGGLNQELEVWTPCWTTDAYLDGADTITMPPADDDKGHDIADAAEALDAKFPVPAWALAIDSEATGWVACYGSRGGYNYYGRRESGDTASPYNWLGLVRMPAPVVRVTELDRRIGRELDADESGEDADTPARPLADLIGPDGVFARLPNGEADLESLESLPLRWVRVNVNLARLVVDFRAPARREAASKGRRAGAARKAEAKKKHDELRDAVADLAGAAKARAGMFLPRACQVNVAYSSWRDDAHTPSFENVDQVLEAYAVLYGLDRLRRITAFRVAAAALRTCGEEEYKKRNWSMPHALLTMLRAARPGSPTVIPTTPLAGGQARCRDCGKEGPVASFVMPSRLRAIWCQLNPGASRPPDVCPRCDGRSHAVSDYEGPIALDEEGDQADTYDHLCWQTKHEAEMARQAAETTTSLAGAADGLAPGPIADAIASDLRAAIGSIEALTGACT